MTFEFWGNPLKRIIKKCKTNPICRLITKRKEIAAARKATNARKHGFYSGTLSPAEACEFWNITNKEGIAPEIAVLRIKLKSLLQNSPGNRRAIMEALKLLVKWYRARYQLNETDTACFKTLIRNLFGSCLGSQDKTTGGGIENV